MALLPQAEKLQISNLALVYTFPSKAKLETRACVQEVYFGK